MKRRKWDSKTKADIVLQGLKGTAVSDICIEHKIINDWVDYYNNERYQWGLAKLSPNEYYDYVMTGEYPLSIKAPRFSVVPSSRVADSEQLKKYSSEEARSN